MPKAWTKADQRWYDVARERHGEAEAERMKADIQNPPLPTVQVGFTDVGIAANLLENPLQESDKWGAIITPLRRILQERPRMRLEVLKILNQWLLYPDELTEVKRQPTGAKKPETESKPKQPKLVDQIAQAEEAGDHPKAERLRIILAKRQAAVTLARAVRSESSAAKQARSA